MSITNRMNDDKKQSHGQFLTPTTIVQQCLSSLKLKDELIVEPSCGEGAFLIELEKEGVKNVFGIELDNTLLDKYIQNGGKYNTINKNFYDVIIEDIPFNDEIKTLHFIGNPPFRSPALSISTHKKEIDRLRKTYNVGGIREEACLFILKTLDLIHSAKLKGKISGGKISYILPDAIFKNNSKVFVKFAKCLEKHLSLTNSLLIEGFPGVSTKLVFMSWELCDKENEEKYYGTDDEIIPFQQIFKKTYLGSVPCESIFLSCPGESKKDFKKRLTSLYIDKVDTSNLIQKLSYDGKPHLRALQKSSKKDIDRINDYVQEFKTLCDVKDVENQNNYKEIQHRKEVRFYFRCDKLKKAKFVYQINSNPCPSFYFPGNPSSTSPDYYGYCDYDANRNSCAGALRCVPIQDVSDNITDEFKKYWKENTNRPITDIFLYLEVVLKSEWYKAYKSKNSRFYFGVPKIFIKDFDNKELSV